MYIVHAHMLHVHACMLHVHCARVKDCHAHWAPFSFEVVWTQPHMNFFFLLHEIIEIPNPATVKAKKISTETKCWSVKSCKKLNDPSTLPSKSWTTTSKFLYKTIMKPFFSSKIFFVVFINLCWFFTRISKNTGVVITNSCLNCTVLWPLAYTVCDDHHFKDEMLFYRFKNDDKTRHSPRLRDRLNSKKGSKKAGKEEDAGSTGDSNDRRESGGSWDSSSDHSHTPHRDTPELDEWVGGCGSEVVPFVVVCGKSILVNCLSGFDQSDWPVKKGMLLRNLSFWKCSYN